MEATCFVKGHLKTPQPVYLLFWGPSKAVYATLHVYCVYCGSGFEIPLPNFELKRTHTGLISAILTFKYHHVTLEKKKKKQPQIPYVH